MRARRTIWRLTGSLSAVVAFPAKTRARSRRSCVRTRRTFVLFVSIITPCRPSGRVVGSWIFQTLGAPEAGWGGTGIAAFVGAVLMITLQRKIWPAQVAHA